MGGNVMKLSDKDGRIVDLLLDRPSVESTGSGAFVKSVDVQPQRVRSIQKVLGALDAYTAADPPTDLESRTLRRIDADIKAGDALSRPPPYIRVDDRPPA
jgi:hypothetical protein